MRARGLLGGGGRPGFRGKRGFLLLVCLSVVMIIMAGALTTQTVALQDLRFASQAMVKTRAYLNARSGIEAALGRLKTQPDSSAIRQGQAVALPLGDYSVEVSRETAEAFGDLLSPLPPATPVYMIEATGRIPLKKRATYNMKITAVVRMVDEAPRILLWSESPGVPTKPGALK